jgi:hypothetical protein
VAPTDLRRPVSDFAMVMTMKHSMLALFTLLACTAAGYAYADEKFEHVAVRLEQNATDEDVEVVFDAISGDIGIAALRVTAPDGRTVIDFRAPNSKLGIRHLVLESPEPVNDGRLQADFPAGSYTFKGTTVTGEHLTSTALLSHTLPGVASFVRPRPKERNVPVTGLHVRWTAPRNLSSCVVILEHEKTGIRLLQATLSGAARIFAIPDGLLTPGAEYKLEIGTVTAEGNRSFVETSFTTAGKK